MVKTDQSNIALVREAFEKNGGILRHRDIVRLGIHKRVINSLEEQGQIDKLARGVYHWSEIELPEQIGMVLISLLVPKAIFCLISALDVHESTTQIPRSVYVSLPNGVRTPKIDYPSIEVFHYRQEEYESSVETHDFGGFKVRVYSLAKTIVDCFKYRNKIGLDVAIEALRDGIQKKGLKPVDIMSLAREANMGKVMHPYVEAIYE